MLEHHYWSDFFNNNCCSKNDFLRRACKFIPIQSNFYRIGDWGVGESWTYTHQVCLIYENSLLSWHISKIALKIRCFPEIISIHSNLCYGIHYHDCRCDHIYNWLLKVVVRNKRIRIRKILYTYLYKSLIVSILCLIQTRNVDILWQLKRSLCVWNDIKWNLLTPVS